MSWLYDKVPQDIIDKAEAVGYNEQLEKEIAVAGDLLPRERLDSIADIRRLVSEPQLTMQVRQDILRRLAKGMFPETACARSGVPVETFNRWLEMGVRGLEPYAQFYREACEAEADWEERINDRIQAEGDTDDLRFLLERRAARPLLADKAKAGGVRYRKQQAVEIDTHHTFEFEKMPDDKKRNILAQLAQQSVDNAAMLPPPGVVQELAAPPDKANVVEQGP